jgi:hypothetical protein
MEKSLENTSMGNDFLNRTPITQEIRAITNNWNCSKLKSICTAKEAIATVNRESTQWMKMFDSYPSDKE